MLCSHPPNVKCIRCLNREALSETDKQQKVKSLPQRCTHGPNTKCLHCMGNSASGGPEQGKKAGKKKVRAMEKAPEVPKGRCNHGEGAVCINCMSTAGVKFDKDKPVTVLCNHPPGVVCVNCMPRREETKTSSGERSAISTDPTVSRRLTAQCTHGAGMFCEHCLPPPPSVDPYTLPPDARDLNEEDPPEKRCVHHGPHGSCVECLAIRESRKMVLARQPKARAALVRVDNAALDNLLDFIKEHKTGPSCPPFRRMAWMLGKVSGSVTTVHAFYEPPQTWPTTVSALRDTVGTLDSSDQATELESNVDLICSSFGLSIVGWAFCHDRRREELTVREIERMAAWQKKFGPGFATLVLKCLYNSKKECIISSEAFQVSDQAVELYSRHNFDYEGGISVTPSYIRLKNPVNTADMRETKTPDVYWLTVPTAIVSLPSDIFRIHDFPAPYRPGCRISGNHIIAFLDDVQRRSENPFSDFNFLLFCSTLQAFSTDDVKAMCSSLLTRSNVEGYIEMLRAIALSL